MAGDLYDENVEASRIADRVENRDFDVPARGGTQAAGDEHRRRQTRGRRFAVRAGDEDPLGGSFIGTEHLVTHSPREFDVAPHRYARLVCPTDHGVSRREARGGDDDFGPVCSDAVGDGAEVAEPELGIDDAHELLVLGRGGLSDDEDIRTEFSESVCNGESRHRRAEDHDAKPAPVRVPAGEFVQRRAHTAASQAT